MSCVTAALRSACLMFESGAFRTRQQEAFDLEYTAGRPTAEMTVNNTPTLDDTTPNNDGATPVLIVVQYDDLMTNI